MLDEEKLLSFNYFRYNGILTGEHHGMRYEISRAGEKPDFILRAFAWPEPFARSKTPDELIIQQQFEYSEDGRKAAIAWLNEVYHADEAKWNEPRPILTAPHKVEEEE